MGQGQSGPEGERGPKGDIGPQGPQGPQGPPGTNASEDPQQVAAILGSNTAFISRLAPIVAKDNSIGSTVAEGVANSVVPRTLVTNALVASDNFRQQLINTMATDTRFRGEQGPPGSAFDDLSIQNALQPKSLWCADGQVCRIPTSAPGTYLTGDTVIQRTKNLYLAGASMTTSGTLSIDTKHGVTVKDTNPVDGPFLYGAAGGQLGTFSQVNSTSGAFALAWGKDPLNIKNTTDTNNVYVSGNLKIRGHDLALGYTNNERGDSVESLALVKDQNNTLKINFQNNFVGGTVIDSNLAIPGDKSLTIGKWKISVEDNGNGALVFGRTDNDHKPFKIHTDSEPQVQLGGWRLRSDASANLKFDREGGNKGQYHFGENGELHSVNIKAHNDIKGNQVYINGLRISREDNDFSYYNKDNSNVFRITNDGQLKFTHGWEIKPDGDFFRFWRHHNRGAIDGRPNEDADILIGTGEFYQIQDDEQGHCIDSGDSNGWHPCNDTRKQKIYFKRRD